MTLDVPPGDLYRIQDLLGEREREILGEVREFLEARVRPIANDCWARAEFPFHLIPEFGGLGIAGMAYDECPGETPSSMLNGFLALEISRVDPSMGTFYGVRAGLAMGSIAACGSAEQRERWLPPMGRMEKIGAFALTEPGGGSDVALGLRTTARREGDEWVIDGAKRWIGNGTFADLLVVWARDVADDSVKGFVLRGDTPC
ncbi:acyl-CoA dehydrogenase family protein [Actinomadura sp. SCN-SB]|uniref:acyl-CoA dehydrogenase family protein n=1 Tax=Actinomadura sp. SCN-SB TaxID=3373092 RepID=UPI0037533B67